MHFNTDNRIFVSSTCYDLIDLRAEIEQFLRDNRLTPVMSDRPTSGFEPCPDQNSIETCLSNLRTCHASIFILSQRYGPILTNYGHKISATHLEYNEAIKLGKPLFLFIRYRLYAEYTIWKRNHEKENLSFAWIKEPQERIQLLFGIIRDHERRITNTASTNWLDQFSDSVHLKAILKSRLPEIGGEAILYELAAKGDMPLLLADVEYRNFDNQGKPIEIHLRIHNAGLTPAINTFIRVNPRIGPNHIIDTGALGIVHSKNLNSAIRSGDSETVHLQCIKGEIPAYSNTIQIEYETVQGFRVRDEHTLVWSPGVVTCHYDGKSMAGRSTIILPHSYPEPIKPGEYQTGHSIQKNADGTITLIPRRTNASVP